MGQKRRDEGKTSSSHMHTATGKTTNGSSSKKKRTKKNESGSCTLNNMKDGSKSKVESGNKDLCGGSTGQKHNEETNNSDVTFIVLLKRDQCTQVKELKMVCEFEGYRWDASLLCETWRHDKEERWEAHPKHIHGYRKL